MREIKFRGKNKERTRSKMEEKICINEYVRTKTGKIDKVINNNYYMPQYIECEKRIVEKKNIVNHSFNIKELIENKDILKVKTKENEILMIGFDENTTDVKYKEIIEEIENGEYELLEILTHEQYERNCYKIN